MHTALIPMSDRCTQGEEGWMKWLMKGRCRLSLDLVIHSK